MSRQFDDVQLRQRRCKWQSLLLTTKQSVKKTFRYQSVSARGVSNARPGQLQGRIVHGNLAEPKQFYYQAVLRSIKGDKASICGGSVVSITFVLTAAHCTKGYKKIEVGFGSNQLKSQRYYIASYVKTEHPHFNPETLANVRKQVRIF